MRPASGGTAYHRHATARTERGLVIRGVRRHHRGGSAYCCVQCRVAVAQCARCFHCPLDAGAEFLSIVAYLRGYPQERQAGGAKCPVDKVIPLAAVFCRMTAIIELYAQSGTQCALVAEQQIDVFAIDAVAPTQSAPKATFMDEE